MNDVFAITRIEKYKYHDCGGVFKEAIRTLPKYDNPNLDPSRSHLNVHLVDKGITNIEKYIVDYKNDNDIAGRFNIVAKNTKNAKNLTNVMCQAIFTCSNEYINDLSREEQIDFFKDCLEFFKQEFPDVPIISAVIHFDETTPHMHLTFLPIAQKVNKKTGELQNVFSTTLLMPGKDFYPNYQDRFYSFISAKYDGLARRKSNRKNLTPEEYRKVAPYFEEYEKQLSDLRSENYLLKKTIFNQKQKLAELFAELKEFNKHRGEITFLESIPLIGVFFEILREMIEEERHRYLLKCIRNAKLELAIEGRLHESLDSQILSVEKKKIVQKLFGNDRDNRNNFER